MMCTKSSWPTHYLQEMRRSKKVEFSWETLDYLLQESNHQDRFEWFSHFKQSYSLKALHSIYTTLAQVKQQIWSVRLWFRTLYKHESNNLAAESHSSQCITLFKHVYVHNTNISARSVTVSPFLSTASVSEAERLFFSRHVSHIVWSRFANIVLVLQAYWIHICSLF